MRSNTTLIYLRQKNLGKSEKQIILNKTFETIAAAGGGF